MAKNQGFKDIPMPTQDVIDQMAATAPQVSPEEMLGKSAEKVAVKSRHSVKPMAQLIDEFMAAINEHPDAKLLTCSIGGTPTKQQEFSDTPSKNQHRAEIRLVWRDPLPEGVVAQESAKPWKYDYLIPKRGQEIKVDAVTPTENPVWDHLVKKREPELVAQ